MSKTSTYIAKKVTLLDEKISELDSILVDLQEDISEDFEVYERIVAVRDAMYHLKAEMRGCEVIDYGSTAGGGSDGLDDDDDAAVTPDYFCTYRLEEDNDHDEEEGEGGVS